MTNKNKNSKVKQFDNTKKLKEQSKEEEKKEKKKKKIYQILLQEYL
ncbi:hypothetical protein NSA50_19095 [Clostridium sp. DSM 100503]|nr:hypothetical protein [Clostridium sp. DSM 100503]MCR1953104.1 hypothetical protein [Clostridium sp. DSM 100503]